MSQIKASEWFARAESLETRFCILLNGSSRHKLIRLFFNVVSRLGDGIFWYVMVALLAYSQASLAGGMRALHILLTGLFAVLVYKTIKQRLVRQRPFIKNQFIQQAAPILDTYSFPSGHTMHAVSFSILFSAYMPVVTSLVWGFAALVALSRVVLGLHYPSDVLAGAFLGVLVAISSLSLAGIIV